MKEVLQKLVESEVLTEDTRKELQEAIETEIKKRVDERVEVRKVELEEEFKSNFESEREKLVEALDKFLEENVRGALAESIREEFKEQFIAEREKLINAISVFLETELDKKIQMVESTKHASEVAFYEAVKSLMIGEQDIPAEAEKIINRLQESLQKKEERINELYQMLVEAKEEVNQTILESKIQEFVNMLPSDKKAAGRRLMEGVSLEDFDRKAELITSELLGESVGGESEVNNTLIEDSKSSSREVVVESHHVTEDEEVRRLRQLSGVK